MIHKDVSRWLNRSLQFILTQLHAAQRRSSALVVFEIIFIDGAKIDIRILEYYYMLKH